MGRAGLYVHIPFCASRCGYCTFASAVYSPEKADAYLAALEKELRACGASVFPDGEKPATIFIGGGTPSVLSEKQLEKLFSFLPESEEEYSCEVNPDSCTREKLSLLRGAGVNRVSFGVQTFNADGLKLLQRRHDGAQAVRAVEMALGMGFASVNIDLINGWPGQTEACVRGDIAQAAGLGVQHIANYNLILEPSASGYERFCALLGGEVADEEAGRRNWEAAEEVLGAAGFVHYEVSNFALPGFCCVHNCMTWRGEEYLGIGLSACSHSAGERRGNVSDFGVYCRGAGRAGGVVAYREKLSREEKARECAVFWLRLFEGVSVRGFFERTGVDFFALYSGVLPGLVEEGVVVVDSGKVRVAREFQPVLDSVLEYFI